MSEKERVLVVVSASDSLLGKIIRKLTGSKVNHTFLLYESNLWGGWWVAQIGPKGVEKLPAEKVRGKYSLVECHEYQESLVDGVQACRGMIGEAYDFLGILGFLFKIIVWRLTGKKIKNPLHGKHEEFCSEFIATILKKSKVCTFETCDPASVDPGEVQRWILNNRKFVQVDWPTA